MYLILSKTKQILHVYNFLPVVNVWGLFLDSYTIVQINIILPISKERLVHAASAQNTPWTRGKNS